MKLIDADALLDEIRKSKDGHNHADQEILMNHHMEHDAFMDLVDAAPTVDAAPVVHGYWIFGTENHREYMKCSVCLKSQTPTGVFTYCPSCGAKMDGREDNEA